MPKLEELEEKIGYRFQAKGLLRQALTHSSFANEKHMKKLSDNERLEFLGDAVLEIISSEFLYKNYPERSEGDLTKLRASIVCEPTLALSARAFELGAYLKLGKGEELTGGRQRNSIVSDAMEALIGAVYLDGGFEAAREFVEKFVLTDIEHKQLFHDSKTSLQEIIQEQYEETPVYVLLRESGPDHAKEFVSEVRIKDRVLGTGTGRSKKQAEQEAAYQALLLLSSNLNGE